MRRIIISGQAFNSQLVVKMTSRIHDESTGALMAPVDSEKALKAATLAEMEVDLILPSNSYHPIPFGALTKLAISAISPKLRYTFFLFAFFIAVGVFIGTCYSDVGNKTNLINENTQCIYYTIVFTIFIGTLPTIITCKTHLK